MFAPWKESYDKPRHHIKNQRHHFTDKSLYSQGHGFSSSHVGMGELNHKEGWALKNWCFWTVVLEKTLESPFDCKEIQQFILMELSPARLFVNPWTAAHQVSLSITNSWNVLKLMSIELVMPSNHLILCHPFLLPPSIFPSVKGLFK